MRLRMLPVTRYTVVVLVVSLPATMVPTTRATRVDPAMAPRGG